MHIDQPVASGPTRHAVNGATMGTRYSAVFFSASQANIEPIAAALQAAVKEVDDQMSTWKPDSDLMEFNRAPVGHWMVLPRELLTVIAAGLEVGRRSNGAFDLGTGDLSQVWGFGPPVKEGAKLSRSLRRPAHELLELDAIAGRLRKHAPISIDLSGIAKGYGVDCLAETLESFSITDYLVSIDGEVRARGRKPGDEKWRVAVERPIRDRREIAGYVDLADSALATSGNYRHVRDVDGQSYSHTVDPRTGRPVANDIGAVTVRAPNCMLADAWATVVVVLGAELGRSLVRSYGMEVLIQP